MISTDDHTGERSASQSVFFSILSLSSARCSISWSRHDVYLPFELILGRCVCRRRDALFAGCVPSRRAVVVHRVDVYLPLLLIALVLTKS